MTALRLRYLLPALILSTSASLSAQHGDGWTADFAAAKASAIAENKDLLLVFTGSDWCAPCIRMAKEVFGTEEFRSRASEHYVLVVIDNPKGEEVITKTVREQNDALMAEFAVNSWPTMFLADSSGRPYARTKDYRPGGPDGYVEHLASLQGNKARRDALLSAAYESSGVERARQLDAAVAACGEFIPMAPYAALIDEIIAADAENEAGLSMRWRTRRAADALEVELPKLGKAGRWRELVTKIDTFLNDFEPDAAVRQKSLYWLGVGLGRLGETKRAKESLDAAIAIDPKSEFGSRSASLLKSFAGSR
ncbi:MAG: thioredoxin fold domain-containing protein [Planctomycetota bacterium]